MQGKYPPDATNRERIVVPMRQLVSLVIPVYNVERYLARCMESVFAQTYENLEILLVEDSSTDSSAELCDEYAAQDKRVRVFHGMSKGLSDARNYGVSQAKGEYVVFIDSDDYVTADCVEYLYTLAEKNGVDMASAANRMVSDDARPTGAEPFPHETKLDTAGGLRYLCYHSVGAWARIYKRSLLLMHPYPKGRLAEDLATTYKLVAECPFSVFSSKVVYYWTQHGRTLSSTFSERQIDILTGAEEQLRYIQEHFPEVENAAKSKCASSSLAFLDTLSYLQDKKEYRKYQIIAYNYLLQYFKTAFFDKEKRIRFKIWLCIARLGYLPTCILWPVRRRILDRRYKHMR